MKKSFNKKGLYKEALDNREVMEGITIDTPEAKILDDALWIEKNDNGGWTLNFYIADSALYYQTVGEKPKSRTTGQTLHPNIGNTNRNTIREFFSLPTNDEKKPVIALSVKTDKDGNILDKTVKRALFKTKGSFTFGEISKKLSQKETPYKEWGKFVKTISPHPIKGEVLSGGTLLRILGNFANHCLAQFALENNIPVLYKNRFLRDSSENWHSLDEVTDVTEEGRKKYYQAFYYHYTVPSYSTEPKGNALKGYDVFAKFSSPLRSFTSTLNIQALAMFLDQTGQQYTKEQIEYQCDTINKFDEKYRNKQKDRKDRLILKNIQNLHDPKQTDHELSKIGNEVLATTLMFLFQSHQEETSDLSKHFKKIINKDILTRKVFEMICSKDGYDLDLEQLKGKKKQKRQINKAVSANKVSNKLNNTDDNLIEISLLRQLHKETENFIYYLNTQMGVFPFVSEACSRLSSQNDINTELLMVCALFNPCQTDAQKILQKLSFEKIIQNKKAAKVIRRAVKDHRLFEEIYFTRHTHKDKVAYRPIIVKDGHPYSILETPYTFKNNKDALLLSYNALLETLIKNSLVPEKRSTMLWDHPNHLKQIERREKQIEKLKRAKEKRDKIAKESEQRRLEKKQQREKDRKRNPKKDARFKP